MDSPPRSAERGRRQYLPRPAVAPWTSRPPGLSPPAAPLLQRLLQRPDRVVPPQQRLLSQLHRSSSNPGLRKVPTYPLGNSHDAGTSLNQELRERHPFITMLMPASRSTPAASRAAIVASACEESAFPSDPYYLQQGLFLPWWWLRSSSTQQPNGPNV